MQTTMKAPAVLLTLLAGFEMVWKIAAAPAQSNGLSEANIEARKPEAKADVAETSSSAEDQYVPIFLYLVF